MHSRSEGGDPLALVYCCDVAVGLTTTLLAESRALGCRIIATLAHGQERNWLPTLVSRAGTPVATDHATLARHLAAALASTGTTAPDLPVSSATQHICEALLRLAGAATQP